MKNLLSFLCVIMMLLSTAPAVAEEPYLSGTELFAQGVQNYRYKAGELEPAAERMTVTFGRPIDLNAAGYLKLAEKGEPVEDNRWIRYYRDALNVDCVYQLTNSNGGDYNQELLLAMTAGELPDIFLVDSPEMINMLAEADAIWDLTEVYQANVNETYGHLLEGEGTGIYGSAIYDGKLYALPQKMPSTNDFNHCWVRRDWLNALDLEIPTTMQDVHDIAKAFMEHYEDNVGFMFSNSFMWEYEGIFWAFGGKQNKDRNQWLMMDDGTLGFAEVQPEMKGGLKWLRDMRAEGLINAEWSTEDTWTALNNYVATGRCGIFFGPHWYGFSLQAYEESMGPEADWIAVGLPAGVDGLEIQVPGNNVVDNYVVVNKEFEHPEIAVQLLNAYTEKLFGENNDFGNFFAVEEDSSYWKATPVWSLSATVDLDPCANLMEGYNAETGEMDVSKLSGTGATYWEYIQNGMSAYQYMFGPVDSAFSFVQKVYPDCMLWNLYQGASTPTQAARWSSMSELIDTYYLKMINGEIDVDAGFDEMVQRWNELGGTDVTREVNEAYNQLK